MLSKSKKVRPGFKMLVINNLVPRLKRREEKVSGNEVE
jgi:hypothetical protein